MENVLDKIFLTTKDVEEILSCSHSKASQIVWQINDELKAKGFLVISGRVLTKQFRKRFGI